MLSTGWAGALSPHREGKCHQVPVPETLGLAALLRVVHMVHWVWHLEDLGCW